MGMCGLTVHVTVAEGFVRFATDKQIGTRAINADLDAGLRQVNGENNRAGKGGKSLRF